MLQFLSLFSGIGAFEKALDRLGVEYNLVNYCEIDKYASKSYSAIHNVPESLNLGDITKVDTSKLSSIDVVSYGFPCQDISLAGKQKGLFDEDGTLTRSGLFFEALRIIEDTKPKVAIAENVKNLTGKKFKEQFEIVLESLETAGYNNYWQVLNAKDYGVPQNRERVFIVSIRKDVDTGVFKFPKAFELKLRLKDLLESEVNEKFYLSGKGVDYVLSPKRGMCTDINADTAQTLTAKGQSNWTGSFISPDIDRLEKSSTIGSDDPTTVHLKNGKTLEVNAKENYVQWDTSGKGYNSQQNRAYYQDGLSPTLSCCNTNGDKSQVILNDKNNIIDSTVNEEYRTVEEYKEYSNFYVTPRGSDGKLINGSYNRVWKPEKHCGALNITKQQEIGEKDNTQSLRIRKLTPLECFRLMGFDDEDFYKAEKVNSNTQLYKQAGNSIVVDVLVYLFKEILEAVDMQRVENKIIVFECDDLIDLAALKEKEPDLYAELVADYPCESATYVFKNQTA